MSVHSHSPVPDIIGLGLPDDGSLLGRVDVFSTVQVHMTLYFFQPFVTNLISGRGLSILKILLEVKLSGSSNFREFTLRLGSGQINAPTKTLKSSSYLVTPERGNFYLLFYVFSFTV